MQSIMRIEPPAQAAGASIATLDGDFGQAELSYEGTKEQPRRTVHLGVRYLSASLLDVERQPVGGHGG